MHPLWLNAAMIRTIAASTKFRQTFPLTLMVTFVLLVTGQFDTSVCNQPA